jgi:hypothetical protein
MIREATRRAPPACSAGLRPPHRPRGLRRGKGSTPPKKPSLRSPRSTWLSCRRASASTRGGSQRRCRVRSQSRASCQATMEGLQDARSAAVVLAVKRRSGPFMTCCRKRPHAPSCACGVQDRGTSARCCARPEPGATGFAATWGAPPPPPACCARDDGSDLQMPAVEASLLEILEGASTAGHAS